MNSKYETSVKEQRLQLGIILSTVVLTFVHYQYGTSTSSTEQIAKKSKPVPEVQAIEEQSEQTKTPLVDHSLANPGILSPTALRSAQLNGKSEKFQ